MKGRFLLDIVVRQSTAVFQLLASKDQTLLIRWNPLFVLNLGLDIIDSVRGFDIKGDGLTREGLDEDLHGERETKQRGQQQVRRQCSLSQTRVFLVLGEASTAK